MGACQSHDDVALAGDILGQKTGQDAKSVRRLSALVDGKNGVWVTRQTSDVRNTYRFGQQLNKGHFGTIHVVTNTKGDRFACKTISKRKLAGVESIKDIRREIEIMHHLRGHPNVVTFYGAYEDENDVYMIMELCEGGDVFERIEGQTTITERQAADLFRQMVEIVDYCHTLGVMHRDLKPENFLCTSRGDDARIKLTDFGLSQFFREGQSTFSEIVGSAYYMAPEVLDGHYGKAVDVWSLGVVLHIILCGLPPFQGNSDQETLNAVRTEPLDLSVAPWPSISRHARHLVTKMLEKDPDKRMRLEQVLTHPWLRPDGTAPARPIPSGVRQRLQQFRSYNTFKKEARKVLAASLPPEEVMGLKLLFEELDTDKDGLLSMPELSEGLAKKGDVLSGKDVIALLQSADLNADGFIDWREFVAATYNLSKMERDEALYKAFQHFDRNRDGFISREELEQAVAHVPVSGRTSIARVLEEADTNQDGRIDYKEFCDMLKQQPMPPMGGSDDDSGGLHMALAGAPAAALDAEDTEGGATAEDTEGAGAYDVDEDGGSRR